MHDLIEPTSCNNNNNNNNNDFSLPIVLEHPICPSVYEDSTYVARSVPSTTATWKQNQHFESKIELLFSFSNIGSARERRSYS